MATKNRGFRISKTEGFTLQYILLRYAKLMENNDFEEPYVEFAKGMAKKLINYEWTYETKD